MRVCVLRGDGIGPEVVESALEVLKKVCQIFNFDLELVEGIIGGQSIDKFGEPITEETLKLCKSSNAVLLGAVGGPKWDDLPTDRRPEKGLLRIRKELNLFANLRPVKVFEGLISSSPLKEEVVRGTDLVVVRELSSGIYYGEPRGIFTKNGIKYGINTMYYSEEEIRRVVRVAFKLAQRRRKKLTSVDKANVLEVSKLWRDVVNSERENFKDVEVEHLYVDNCSMQLIRRPSSFDVIVTGNIFGDILSDEAGVISGSLGMLPSASVGERYALYEPVHGSAPDIAGKGIANPIGTILSVALMMEYSFGFEPAKKLIEDAVDETLKEGYRTPDIYSRGDKEVGTKEMTQKILQKVEKLING